MYKPIAETNGLYAVNEEGSVIRLERPSASRKTNVNRGNIASVLSGKRTSAGGYRWKYKEDK